MNIPSNYIQHFRRAKKLRKWGSDIGAYVIRHGINDKTVMTKAFWVRYKPRYQSVLFSGKRYPVSDVNNDSDLADQVIIRNCKPLSKTKHYYVRKIEKFGIRKKMWDNLTQEQGVGFLIIILGLGWLYVVKNWDISSCQ